MNLIIKQNIDNYNEINEKFGIPEFNNSAYIEKVESIISGILSVSNFNITIPEISDSIKFAKITIDFSKILYWLKTLNVYVTNDVNFIQIIKGDSIVTNLDNDDLLKLYFSKLKTCYFKASIFMCISGKSKRRILEILYHELGHLYDNTHFVNNDGKDLEYFLNNSNDNLYKFDTICNENDLHTLTSENIFDFLTYCIYYSNITEKHAFLETINFQLCDSISDNKKFNKILSNSKKDYVSISNNCSYIINDYYWITKNLELLQLNINYIKNIVNADKCKELQTILKVKNIKGVIQRLYENTKHTYNNGIKLFNYYLKLFNKNSIINENIKTEYFNSLSKDKKLQILSL